MTAAGLTTLVGLFYYGYAPFSLVAGVAMDQLGPRKVVPLGCALMGVGALLFATGDPTIASFGRFLQGCAGVFALIGAAYIATTNFPASRAATLIGATQMFGMAGGSAGQFLVGPAIGGGLAWNQFWTIMGIIGPLIALALWYFIPARKVEAAPGAPRGAWAGQAARAMGLVFRNPQSILCGLIAGLMFLPTTIFDMVWGVRFLQEGHDLPYSVAVLRSASVPFGWIIGCPLLGLHLRPDRAAQAGDHRQREPCCSSASCSFSTARPACSRPSASACSTGIASGRSDASLHGDQGGQSAGA